MLQGKAPTPKKKTITPFPSQGEVAFMSHNSTQNANNPDQKLKV